MSRDIRVQCFILDDDKILFNHQYNEKRKEHYWMLLGGGVDENETLEEAIKREMIEELGIEVSDVELISDMPSKGSDVYNRYMTYLVSADIKKLQIGAETVSYRKILSHDWISLNDELEWHTGVLSDQILPSLGELKLIRS